MKWFIILLLMSLMVMLIATRYRRQIGNIVHLWRVLKKMNNNDGRETKRFDRPEKSGEVPLVKCAGCGVWTPEKNALKLRSENYFCSAECLELSVRVH